MFCYNIQPNMFCMGMTMGMSMGMNLGMAMSNPFPSPVVSYQQPLLSMAPMMPVDTFQSSTPQIPSFAFNTVPNYLTRIQADFLAASQKLAEMNAQLLANLSTWNSSVPQNPVQGNSTITIPPTPSQNPTGGGSSTISDIDISSSSLKPGLFKGRLAGQEALVSRLCKKYNVSAALVASIIGLESGWGTSNLAMHNNFGGYRAAGDLGKNPRGFGYFSTIEKGLEAMIKNIAGYTRYKTVSAVNFENLDAIGAIYCEGGRWANQIREVYQSRVKNYLA